MSAVVRIIDYKRTYNINAIEPVLTSKANATLDEGLAILRGRGHLREESRVVDAAGVLARAIRHRPAANGERGRARRIDLMNPVVEARTQVEIVVLVWDDREIVCHEQERVVQLKPVLVFLEVRRVERSRT